MFIFFSITACALSLFGKIFKTNFRSSSSWNRFQYDRQTSVRFFVPIKDNSIGFFRRSIRRFVNTIVRIPSKFRGILSGATYLKRKKTNDKSKRWCSLKFFCYKLLDRKPRSKTRVHLLHHFRFGTEQWNVGRFHLSLFLYWIPLFHIPSVSSSLVPSTFSWVF